MKEHPILFSAPMVRALLAGTKTQTRRAAKQRGIELSDADVGWSPKHPTGPTWAAWWPEYPCEGSFPLTCPYGQPGDRLWVREAWALHPDYVGRAIYRADPGCEYDVDRWSPSIHMPRWASRITLEVTGVRMERLQDISEADAIAEGIERGDGFPGWYRGPLPGDAEELQQAGRDFKIPTAFARLAYQALWESINGHGSWGGDPWVWVIEFRRLP